jgi:multidrug efflux pump subunit AcrA (membrane-fusion protein)
MIGRLPIAVLAVAGGIAVASLIPEIPRAVRDGIGLVVGADRMRAGEPAEEGEQRKSKGDSRSEGVDEPPANMRLTTNRIETAGIELATVQDGTLTHRIVVPGTIVPHADRIARVSVRLPAMVTELRKVLGEHVDKGEIVAVLESRPTPRATTSRRGSTTTCNRTCSSGKRPCGTSAFRASNSGCGRAMRPPPPKCASTSRDKSCSRSG